MGAAVEEHELVERGRSGDRDALAELYLLHVDRIYGYLAGSVGNVHDAEDLTSQTFSRMLEGLDRFEQRGIPFSAWLFRIAHNVAMDHFRVGRRCRPEAEPPEPDGAELSAEDAAIRGLGDRRVTDLALRLSDDQRRVIALRLLLGRSNAEAASALGKTEGAVKALQRRAIASLERQLASG